MFLLCFDFGSRPNIGSNSLGGRRGQRQLLTIPVAIAPVVAGLRGELARVAGLHCMICSHSVIRVWGLWPAGILCVEATYGGLWLGMEGIDFESGAHGARKNILNF